MKLIYVILILLPALALANEPEGLFALVDRNGDEAISMIEFELYFLTFDANRDGEITEPEFAAGLDRADPYFYGQEAAIFSVIDRDLNGRVNRADLDSFYIVLDSNRDREIDEDEFNAVFSVGGGGGDGD